MVLLNSLKRKLHMFIIAMLLLSVSQLRAQDNTKIEIIKRPLGTIFQQDGKVLAPKQIMKITQSNPEAYEEMRKAKSNYNISQLFATVGGFLIGWPLGTAIGGGEPDWALAGVGASFVLISIPFGSTYTKHASKAVNLYNQKETVPPDNPNLKLHLAPNGINLSLVF